MEQRVFLTDDTETTGHLCEEKKQNLHMNLNTPV